MSDHVLRRLTERVWWLNPVSATDRPTLGVIVGERGSLVVDAGNSSAHVGVLRAEMERNGLPAPLLAALTHWHWDHVFGLAALGVPALASRETQRVVGVMAGLDWGDAALERRVAEGREIAFCADMIRHELPDRAELALRVPEIAFDDAVTVDLGGLACDLIYVGGDHSPDAIIAHVPREGVVFFGDATYDDLYHGSRRLTAGRLFPLLDRLLALGAEHYVGGHDPEPIPRARFAADAAELRAIGELVGRIGDEREAVLAALPAALGVPLAEDHVMIADAFLAGLRMPEAASPL